MIPEPELLARLCQIIVGLLLSIAGGAKVFSFRWFVEAVRNYKVVPSALVPPAAIVIVSAEVVVGLLLASGRGLPWAAYWAVALLGVLTSAVGVILIGGRKDVPCG